MGMALWPSFPSPKTFAVRGASIRVNIYRIRLAKDWGQGMALSVKQSGAALGAEIGFDLSRDMDEPQFRAIEAAFHDNIVVVFRGQTLSNERHIEFSRRFGPLDNHIVRKYLLPDYPEILRISNVRDENGELIGLADAGFTWHTDTSYLQTPSRCSLLHAKEVPHRDGQPLGDTVFANAIAAYEALPDAMKRRIAGRKAVHRYSERKRIDNSPRPKLTKAQLEATPDVAHPIVRTHPATGRKALYVTEGECIGIEGMPDDEGRPLIAELHAHCIRPEFQYRHKWQVGDLLMWDNATSMHLAICDYSLPERRLMYRTTVIGGVPF
jgi:taurine dioxygenase